MTMNSKNKKEVEKNGYWNMVIKYLAKHLVTSE
jgi:hypothetical protein